MWHRHQFKFPSLVIAVLLISMHSGCHEEPPGKAPSVPEPPAIPSDSSAAEAPAAMPNGQPGEPEQKISQPDGSGSDTLVRKLSPKSHELLGEPPIRRELVIDQPANIFIYEGQILLPPYRLIQTDYRLILEGTNHSVLLTDYPVAHPDCPESLPELPDYIKADSSWEQIESHIKYPPSLFNLAIEYYRCRFPTTEAAQKFTEYLRGLPFIASAKWSEDPNGEFNASKLQLLVVITKAGDRRDFFTNWWDWSKLDQLEKDGGGFFKPTLDGFPKTNMLLTGSPDRIEFLRKLLDQHWDNFSHRLRAGSFYIFDGKKFDTTTLPGQDRHRHLQHIGEILQEKTSANERASQLLTELRILDFQEASWRPLLEYFIDLYDRSAEIRTGIQEIIKQNDPMTVVPSLTPQ